MSVDAKLRIPEYVIQEEIARGGFGLVWRAIHKPSNQQVAIKVLHADLVGSHDIILRFQREAETIAQLHHPNVVELYECGRLEDGRPYLVMEHLQGHDLATHIELNGPLSPTDATHVIRALASALTAAHALGIVHRDIKASNVVLSERDGALRVVLLDFGIAKLIERAGEPITAVRQAVGSPVCISPEQIRGDDVDSRTDVYGLGSLVFHMLTGSPPFGSNWLAAMDQHLFAERPRPSDRLDISVAFDDVVVRAMSLEREQRFANAHELFAAWCAALEESTGDAGETAENPASQQVIGCYVDVHADMADLDEPEEALINDMDSIFPLAAEYLESRGFTLAYESGDSALFVLPYTNVSLRAQAVNDALDLLQRIYLRSARHHGVHVNLFLHADSAVMSEGSVIGGEILDATSWVVPVDAYAVLVSQELAQGLALGPYATPVNDRVISIYQLDDR